MKESKVVVWGASSQLGSLLCERLFTQGYDVTAVDFSNEDSNDKFEGGFQEIKCINHLDMESHLESYETDINIFIDSSVNVSLDSFEKNLENCWKCTESSYENFYRQRDGELILISLYSENSLWRYKNMQGIESVWKKRFHKINSQIKHLSFHEQELVHLDRICQNIEKRMHLSTPLFSILKNIFSALIYKLKNLAKR